MFCIFYIYYTLKLILERVRGEVGRAKARRGERIWENCRIGLRTAEWAKNRGMRGRQETRRCVRIGEAKSQEIFCEYFVNNL